MPFDALRLIVECMGEKQDKNTVSEGLKMQGDIVHSSRSAFLCGDGEIIGTTKRILENTGFLIL